MLSLKKEGLEVLVGVEKKVISHIEVKGFEARFYDIIMNIASFGTYPRFIRDVIGMLPLKEGDWVLDFGAGTGRNDCLILKKIGNRGGISALEIGKEMKEQFIKRCGHFKNVELISQRIEEDFTLEREYDVAFISFVLHGFEQNDRLSIIKNAYKHLKSDGYFCILDYNEIDVSQSNFLVKLLFRLECPLALDFTKRDLIRMLDEFGFRFSFQKTYYFDVVRLICFKKVA
jgi:demethylmenaquinone methyltransferase/2-methoxy-6-polyprenyl-1,4-benzoquinol methylase